MREWSNGGDCKRVDRSMAFGIMVFDVVEISSLLEPWDVPVQVS